MTKYTRILALPHIVVPRDQRSEVVKSMRQAGIEGVEVWGYTEPSPGD